jgi:uncharacterized protein (DUF1800 family)
MRIPVRIACALLGATALVGLLGLTTSSGPKETVQLTKRERAIHALNRLGFGPRPGDVERVLAMGVDTWAEQQLSPDRIPDLTVGNRLKGLPTVLLSTAELFDQFERSLREARRERKRELSGKQDGGKESAETVNIEKIQKTIPPENRRRRILEELSTARVLRAAYSQRQLNETMVDFWLNHFNVFANKGLDRVFITSFERDTIRPLIWGRFEDLLMATAKSPAMLFYLDNARSTADLEHRPPAAARRDGFLGRPTRRQIDPEIAKQIQENAPKGINENYARELMELHTLGVDGGYSQKDVTELARVLTGWSIRRRGVELGGFEFRPRMHDIGAKTVLGYELSPGGGIEEGERMIRILANHPSTAHHIAYQLCQRLVADDPPAELVDRVARTFLATGGDLRQTVRAIVESPEFFHPKFYRVKVKSPFEYVVSALRAAGGQTDGRLPIFRAIAQMGEPLYLCQPPTGYSDDASAWVNTGSLMARLNFALELAADRIPGTEVDWSSLVRPEEAADPKKSVEALARALTGGDLTLETRQTIEKRLEERMASTEDPSTDTRLALIAGLILGSPEFQRQ